VAKRDLSDAEIDAILQATAVEEESCAGGDAPKGSSCGSHPASDILARYQMSRASLSAERPHWVDRLRANLASVFPTRLLGFANSFALGAAAVLVLMHLQLVVPGNRLDEHGPALQELNEKRLVLTEKTAALEQERAALERERVTLAERTAAMEAERLAVGKYASSATVAQAQPQPPSVPAETQSSSEPVIRSEDRSVPWKRAEPVVVRMIADSFEGSLMLSGLPYDPAEPVAASASLPIGTRVRIMNPINGLSVDVTILDKPGPESDPKGLVVSRSVYERLGYDPNHAGAPRLKQRTLDGSV
jgi:rare lipoprotein A